MGQHVEDGPQHTASRGEQAHSPASTHPMLAASTQHSGGVDDVQDYIRSVAGGQLELKQDAVWGRHLVASSGGVRHACHCTHTGVAYLPHICLGVHVQLCTLCFLCDN